MPKFLNRPFVTLYSCYAMSISQIPNRLFSIYQKVLALVFSRTAIASSFPYHQAQPAIFHDFANSNILEGPYCYLWWRDLACFWLALSSSRELENDVQAAAHHLEQSVIEWVQVQRNRWFLDYLPLLPKSLKNTPVQRLYTPRASYSPYEARHACKISRIRTVPDYQVLCVMFARILAHLYL